MTGGISQQALEAMLWFDRFVCLRLVVKGWTGGGGYGEVGAHDRDVEKCGVCP